MNHSEYSSNSYTTWKTTFLAFISYILIVKIELQRAEKYSKDALVNDHADSQPFKTEFNNARHKNSPGVNRSQ